MRLLIILFFALCTMSFSSCATRVVTKPAKVTIVKTAPRHYKIVKVRGKRYYFWNGNHYKKTRRGFVIVRV
ncbi:DUF6515 family protein [Flavivirga jejuensis]|uniref:Uncharacterized protein n=1 Tax=Flavivirga jejuensis TaxID=870487 RepID=A0ABT8WHF8_9FLAO|nr:DUF6515 family protein [Flavivirga jejuensis]MDO5972565.1 hypothetical protein [Flavivirga jejuensis]